MGRLGLFLIVHSVGDEVVPYNRARLAGARTDRRGGQLVLVGGAPTRCLIHTLKPFDCGGMADVSPGYGQVELSHVARTWVTALLTGMVHGHKSLPKEGEVC
jgi:hypothetical protein